MHIFDEHDPSTEALTLRGHQSLPLSLVSIRPPISDFIEIKLEPHTGGFNYLTSGADRKIIVWNQQGKIISSISTENVVTVLAS